MLVTASHEAEQAGGIEAGADDFLTKPINPAELRARLSSLVRLKRYTDDPDSAESVILSLALMIEARDAYTEGHRLITVARDEYLEPMLRQQMPSLLAVGVQVIDDE